MFLCCCCGSGTETIKKPYVTRAAVEKDAVYDRENLPLGALLTGAEKLHGSSLTGSGVRVGVIDSGVDHEHPSFDGMVKKQEWYRSGSSLTEDDHGTHVAGTIHFMAPDAELYDYRVFGANGRVGVTEAIRLAILQAVKDECHVINMSLGGPVPSPGIEKAIKVATEAGVLCICAAGNSGDGDGLTNEDSYPANFDDCVSVAAVSKKDGLPVANFSNSNPKVDYSGIGVDVVSLKPYGGFQKMSGTSMACPHVCGFVAAIMSSSNEGDNKTPDAVRKRLTEEFSVDIGLPGKDNSTGLGFVTYLNKEELTGYFAKMGINMVGPTANVY